MSKAISRSSTANPWRLTTERIVIAGVLAAITIILGVVPNLGFIPLPTGVNATTEHIPTIIGGVIGGPIVGIVSGFIFGLLSFLRAAPPAIFFRDPTVSILPRLFIGLTAWATFAALVRVNLDLAAIVAGVVGSLTNTVLVVGMIIIRGYLPPAFIVAVIPQAVGEAIVAAIITLIVTRAFFIIQSRVVRARDTKAREELPY